MIRQRRTFKDKDIFILFVLSISFLIFMLISGLLIFINKYIFIPILIVSCLIEVYLLYTLFRHISMHKYHVNKNIKDEINNALNGYFGKYRDDLYNIMIDTYKVSKRINYNEIKAINDYLGEDLLSDNKVGYILSLIYVYAREDKYKYLTTKVPLFRLTKMLSFISYEDARELLGFYLTNDLDECLKIIYNSSYGDTGLHKYEAEMYYNILFLADMIDKDKYDSLFNTSYLYDEFKHKRCLIMDKNNKYIVSFDMFFNGWYKASNDKEFDSRDKAVEAVNNFFKK